MNKNSKNTKIIAIAVIVLLLITLFFVWGNNSIVISKSDYINSSLPFEFEDFTIVQVSDLHNKNFGDNQSTILNKIKSFFPDIIVVTGDLIDRRRYDLNTAMTFIEGAIDIAPVYYVSGNHEEWSGNYPAIIEALIDSGVKVLENSEMRIKKGNSEIQILGLKDPAFRTTINSDYIDVEFITNQLKMWSEDVTFKILLSHRPELFNLYCDYNMDLIFSGHAHGGQFRLPFIGAVYAPNQGLFPKYTSGSYDNQNSRMYVSRGLGNSVIPIRIFNRPELVVVTLKSVK